MSEEIACSGPGKDVSIFRRKRPAVSTQTSSAPSPARAGTFDTGPLDSYGTTADRMAHHFTWHTPSMHPLVVPLVGKSGKQVSDAKRSPCTYRTSRFSGLYADIPKVVPRISLRASSATRLVGHIHNPPPTLMARSPTDFASLPPLELSLPGTALPAAAACEDADKLFEAAAPAPTLARDDDILISVSAALSGHILTQVSLPLRAVGFDLKERIEQATGTAAAQQKLLICGRILGDFDVITEIVDSVEGLVAVALLVQQEKATWPPLRPLKADSDGRVDYLPGGPSHGALGTAFSIAGRYERA